MIEKFLDTIRKHSLLQKGDGVVVALSGGPDSVSLLHLLWKVKEIYNLKLFAVHLNHQFRGKEAEKDVEYVRDLCNTLNIPVFIYTEDVTAYAQKNKMTPEEAGRELRYKYFYQVLNKKKAQKIAVAQNMNDQAETVLMRLMRGTGIDGLGAIEYKREDLIIRPLLDIERGEIEEYCKENKLNPRIDKTNLEAVYTRNRIRLELIPYIEKYFNKNIKTTLCRTANLLKEDSDFINLATDEFYNNIVKESEKEIRVDIKGFRKCHIAIKKRILRKSIKRISRELRDVESRHIEIILDFIKEGRTGGSLNLPNNISAVLEYDTFVLKKWGTLSVNNFEYKLALGETIFIEEINAYISTRILNPTEVELNVDKRNIKFFDFNKVKKGITVRNRKNGDSFVPLGMTGTKKLKDFFIDEKIPREKRKKIPIVCDGEEIMWIVGYRISNKYKIDNSTKKILEVKFKNL